MYANKKHFRMINALWLQDNVLIKADGGFNYIISTVTERLKLYLDALFQSFPLIYSLLNDFSPKKKQIIIWNVIANACIFVILHVFGGRRRKKRRNRMLFKIFLCDSHQRKSTTYTVIIGSFTLVILKMRLIWEINVSL